MDTEIIGQAKTVLIIDGQGIITSIHTQKKEKTSEERIKIVGDTKINTDALHHISTTILPLIDKIVISLGLKPRNYEVTIKSIAAAAIKDLKLEISGHSSDISIFLSILSASLQLPISQETVFTGGIGTSDGYLVPVSGLPEKIKATAESININQFMYSSFEQDGSASSLTPKENERIRQVLMDFKKTLKFSAADNIFEIVAMNIPGDTICIASLRSGFYSNKKLSIPDHGPVDHTILHLYNNNDKRFWKLIEKNLLKAEIGQFKENMKTFCFYFIDQTIYPENFGEKLLQLTISIPPAIKRKTDVYPLLEMEKYIRITQFAQESDYNDVKKLFRASFGDSTQLLRPLKAAETEQKAKHPETNTLLDQFLAELSSENIAREVLLPIDAARASFTTDKVTVESYEEFLETITAFYAHMHRHLGRISGDADQKQIASHALDLVKRAFSLNGEEKAAFNEAKTGVNGGLRYIFDHMTNRFKMDERSKYVEMILKTAIDPKDFKTKTILIKALIDQLGSTLPNEIRNQPPERYADDFDKLIEAYAQSQDKLLETIKIL